jgi:F-box/WD-40 domain protein 7
MQMLECLETLNGHNNWVFALAFANGLLFSGSSDHTIKVLILLLLHKMQSMHTQWEQVWSTDTLRCITTLTGHTDQVRALAITDSALFSGSYDCTIKVYNRAFFLLLFLNK